MSGAQPIELKDVGITNPQAGADSGQNQTEGWENSDQISVEEDVFSLATFSLLQGRYKTDKNCHIVVSDEAPADPSKGKDPLVSQRYRIMLWALFTLLLEAIGVSTILVETVEGKCLTNSITTLAPMMTPPASSLVPPAPTASSSSSEGAKPCDSSSMTLSRLTAIFLLMQLLGAEAADTLTMWIVVLKGCPGIKDLFACCCGCGESTAAAAEQGSAAQTTANDRVAAVYWWLIYVLMSFVRLIVALALFFACYMIIRDSETILDIWKDCLAIVFLVEVDSVMFATMKRGLLGHDAKACAMAAAGKSITIQGYVTTEGDASCAHWFSFRTFLTVVHISVSVSAIVLMYVDTRVSSFGELGCKFVERARDSQAQIDGLFAINNITACPVKP